MRVFNRQDSSLAACIRPLLEALGWRGNPVSLSEIIPPSKTSWTLGEVIQRLEVLGFVGKTQRIPKTPRKLVFPLLVLGQDGVWTVVGEAPGVGKTWAGCLCISFVRIPPASTARVSTYWLQELISAHRGALGMALTYSFVLAIFGIMSPQFIGLLYQEITTMTNPTGLISLGMGAMLFAAGEVAFLGLRQLLLNQLSRESGDVIGREVIRRVLYFPLALSLNVGAQAQAARIREFEDLARLLGQPMFRSLLDLPFMILLVISLAFLGGIMVVVPLVTIAVFLVLSLLVLPLLRKADQDAGADLGAVNTRLDAVLDHGDSLRVLGIDFHWKHNLDRAERKAMPSSLARSHINSIFQSLSFAMVSMAGVLAVVLGVGEVLAERLPPGALLASMMLIWRILDPFRSVFVLVGTIHSSTQSGKRLQKFMAIPGESKADPGRPNLVLDTHEVRAEGFYFKYPQSLRFALANVSFHVHEGEILQIKGSAGSGKSSLCMALLGLLEGHSGRISVGELNVRQYHSISYRRNLNYLPRQVPILPLYLKDNLLLSRPEASDEELWEALDEAGLAEVVRDLPHGLDTKLDADFTCGRSDFFRSVGLARLYLRPAKLWILDEPEEGLELGTRRKLLDALTRRKGQVTMILFTNDNDFAALADQHGELDQGRYLKVNP